MAITLEEVKELIATLEKLMLYKGHPHLSRYDFHAMMQLYHMRDYKSSNEDYNARTQLGQLSSSIYKCSPQVAEHLKPFLDKHTYIDRNATNCKLSVYEKAPIAIIPLIVICVTLAIVYFIVKLIFF